MPRICDLALLNPRPNTSQLLRRSLEPMLRAEGIVESPDTALAYLTSTVTFIGFAFRIADGNHDRESREPA